MPEYQLGTAYGMMQSIQNLGLAVVGYAAGIVSAKVQIQRFFHSYYLFSSNSNSFKMQNFLFESPKY